MSYSSENVALKPIYVHLTEGDNSSVGPIEMVIDILVPELIFFDAPGQLTIDTKIRFDIPKGAHGEFRPGDIFKDGMFEEIKPFFIDYLDKESIKLNIVYNDTGDCRCWKGVKLGTVTLRGPFDPHMIFSQD